MGFLENAFLQMAEKKIKRKLTISEVETILTFLKSAKLSEAYLFINKCKK